MSGDESAGRPYRRAQLARFDDDPIARVHIPFEEAKMRRQLRREGAALDMTVIAAVHESAIGTKRTSRMHQRMSAFGGKADIGLTPRNVCF
jgi:hypothetical protein